MKSQITFNCKNSCYIRNILIEIGDTIATTPYDVIGEKALYDMIDYFYFLVENDQRINHLFPGDFKETSRK